MTEIRSILMVCCSIESKESLKPAKMDLNSVTVTGGKIQSTTEFHSELMASCLIELKENLKSAKMDRTTG